MLLLVEDTMILLTFLRMAWNKFVRDDDAGVVCDNNLHCSSLSYLFKINVLEVAAKT